jgi:hypothetical protein
MPSTVEKSVTPPQNASDYDASGHKIRNQDEVDGFESPEKIPTTSKIIHEDHVVLE